MPFHCSSSYAGTPEIPMSSERHCKVKVTSHYFLLIHSLTSGMSFLVHSAVGANTHLTSHFSRSLIQAFHQSLPSYLLHCSSTSLSTSENLPILTLLLSIPSCMYNRLSMQPVYKTCASPGLSTKPGHHRAPQNLPPHHKEVLHWLGPVTLVISWLTAAVALSAFVTVSMTCLRKDR